MQEHFLMKHIKIFFEASCNKGAFIMPKNRKDYFTDTDYTYNKAENQLELLQTDLAIFQALINNIELYMKIQTEFTTVSPAYKNLRDRIDELEKRIAE